MYTVQDQGETEVSGHAEVEVLGGKAKAEHKEGLDVKTKANRFCVNANAKT